MSLVLTKEEDKTYPELPVATVLQGTITAVDESVKDFGRGEVTLVDIVVEVDDQEVPEGTTVKGSASAYISPKSKLNKWITALRGGRELGIGEEFDLNTLIGQPCQFMVECTEKPGKNNPSQMVKFFNISDFVAVRQSAPRQSAPAAAPTPTATATGGGRRARGF